MDNKEMFLTLYYKGCYIQTCYNITQNKEEISFMNKEYKSLHAAKIAVDKYLK